FFHRTKGRGIGLQVELAVLHGGKGSRLEQHSGNSVRKVGAVQAVEDHRRYGHLAFEAFTPGFPIDHLGHQALILLRNGITAAAGYQTSGGRSVRDGNEQYLSWINGGTFQPVVINYVLLLHVETLADEKDAVPPLYRVPGHGRLGPGGLE